MPIEALCEAVSVDLGSTHRDRHAIPDEDDILRWCSSLVRKSADGRRLELAHFTVQEFLQQIDLSHDTLIGAYRIDLDADKIICAKIYLTYLNYKDFNDYSPFGQQVSNRRFQEYPLRRYPVHRSSIRNDLHHYQDDDQIFSLLRKLFNPSKLNTFISWLHDTTALVFEKRKAFHAPSDKSLNFLNSRLAETSTLHWAAMLGFAKVCSWLIKSGCELNRDGAWGTPLHFALLGLNVFFLTPMDFFHSHCAHEVSDLLVEAGADTKCYRVAGNENQSTLSIALATRYYKLVIKLLDSGELLDKFNLSQPEFLMGRKCDPEELHRMIDHTGFINVHPDHYRRLLQIKIRANAVNATHLMEKVNSLTFQKTEYEQMLRTAAELGQVEIVKSLLEDHKLDPNAIDESTGLTALHQAAKTDQLLILQVLINHRADWSILDSQGWTALHHSAQGKGLCCLKFLLWHLTAQKNNVQALTIPSSKPENLRSMIGVKAKDGRTPLLCASTNESEEAIRLIVDVGGSLKDTAADGSSALHYAASSGSVKVIKFIFGQAFNPSVVTCDGSSAIHCAIENNHKNLSKILQILLENGVDPLQTRNDGWTPLGTIVRIIKKTHSNPLRIEHIFDAGVTLLASLLDKSEPTSNAKEGSELIYLACTVSFRKAKETVSALVRFGVDCNIRFNGGRTALMAAAQRRRDDVLSVLLLHGADTSCVDDVGMTIVHYAAGCGDEDMLELLRETSIDWNSKAKIRQFGVWRTNVTALHIAAGKKSRKVLEYLLNENLMSDINARTSTGETPLLVAVRARSARNVSLLLSKGADSSCVDDLGNTAIHYAAEYGNGDIISEFLRNGSDMGVPNSLGLTPELTARKHNHRHLADIIMDYVFDQGGPPRSVSSQNCLIHFRCPPTV